MMGGPDFQERRGATPLGNTDSVPAGTMVCVPSAPEKGPTGSSPVVAANNKHWWQDPGFLSAAGGALLSIADPVVEVLTSSQPFHWRPFVAGCVLALVAYFRKKTNSVIR